MTVPAGWESYAVFKPDSPAIVADMYAVGPEARRAAAATDAEPYARLIVWRTPRGPFSLERELTAANWWCRTCATDLRQDRRVVRVGQRWGVLTDADRSDGSREWILFVQNDCFTYQAHARVVSEHVADASAAVERVLASARIKARVRSGRAFSPTCVAG